MSTIAVPSPASTPRIKWKYLGGGLVSLIIVLLVAGFLTNWGTFSVSKGPDLTGNNFFTVVPMNLDVRINKDGELQAINNIDINCDVEGQTTITQIVKEGTFVKK